MSSATRRRKKPKEKGPEKKEGVVEEVEEEVKKVEKAAVKEARKVEKAVERKPERRKVRAAKPAGRAPLAMVVSRRGTGMVTRAGRGFSIGELSAGGLAPGLAARWGVRIDSRRRSVLDGNVGSLKAWHTGGGAKGRIEHEAKVVEEDLEKLGKEVEKEAVAVEREAVKAEKAVRKEAKKAGKAVKEKVEKKPRPKKKAP